MSEPSRVDEEIAFLLGLTVEECAHHLTPAGWGEDCRGWRAAQIASGVVPVACCVRCRGEEVRTGGLHDRGTTHRQCWPEAFYPAEPSELQQQINAMAAAARARIAAGAVDETGRAQARRGGTMQVIKVFAGNWNSAFRNAKVGDEFRLLIHELKYPIEVRANPPRIRILEAGAVGHIPCELVDPWPDAPEYWPPETAPGAPAPALTTTRVPAPPAPRRRRTQRAQDVPETTDHGGEAV